MPLRIVCRFLLVSFSLGCEPATPSWIDVTPLRATEERVGPYQVSATYSPGLGEHQAWLLLGFAPFEGHASDCEIIPGNEFEEMTGCVAVPLVKDGSKWLGRFRLRDVDPGTGVFYRFFLEDGEGQKALWPVAGVARFEVGGRVPLQLIGIAPTSGPSLGDVSVLLRGEGLREDVEVFFGDSPAVIEQLSDSKMTVRAPRGRAGFVDVSARLLDEVQVLPSAFEYLPSPFIAGVAPSIGRALEVNFAIVSGGEFQDGARVFFGDEEAEVVPLSQDDRLGVLTPPSSAGLREVRVLNPDGQEVSIENAFEFLAAPVVDGLMPAQGADRGSEEVIIEGSGFRSPVMVYFGNRAGTLAEVRNEGREISVQTPPGAPGGVNIEVYNPDGQSAVAELVYTYVGPPVIERVGDGVLARCGGEIVTIDGRNFQAGSVVIVGGLEIEALEVSEDGTRLSFVNPGGIVGPVRVEVVNPDGRTARTEQARLERRPVVNNLTPATVPVWGSGEVVITGSDLDLSQTVAVGEREDGRFRIASNEEGGTCSSTLILVPPPQMAPGPYPVTVVSRSGVETLSDQELLYIAPTLEPSEGLTAGFTNVVISGIGLSDDVQLVFGEETPVSVERISDERWQLVMPPGTKGPTDVTFIKQAEFRSTLEAPFFYKEYRDTPWPGIPGGCADVSVGDLDGDGDLDLAVGRGGITQIEQTPFSPSVMINDGQGNFTLREFLPLADTTNVRMGDIDGDGDLDLLYSNLNGIRTPNGAEVSRNLLYVNDGRGGFTLDERFEQRSNSYDGDFVDIDDDGDLDLFFVNLGLNDSEERAVPEELWINDGSGQFTRDLNRVPVEERELHDHDFAAGDLDGNGFQDLVIVVENLQQITRSSQNRIFFNFGPDEPFRVERPAALNEIRGDWVDVKIIDIDVDGDLDILMPEFFGTASNDVGQPGLWVFLNDGFGNFQRQDDLIANANLPNRLRLFEVVPADLDDDGDLDLLVAGFDDTLPTGSAPIPVQSLILLNDGRANFFSGTSTFDTVKRIATTNFAVADFDGDGDQDLMECADDGGSTLWSLGN